jgi:hypothetical protein
MSATPVVNLSKGLISFPPPSRPLAFLFSRQSYETAAIGMLMREERERERERDFRLQRRRSRRKKKIREGAMAS